MRSIIAVALMMLTGCGSGHEVPGYAEESVGTIRNDAAAQPKIADASVDAAGAPLAKDQSVNASYVELTPVVPPAINITGQNFVCHSGDYTCAANNGGVIFNRETGVVFDILYFMRQYHDIDPEVLKTLIKYNDPRVGCYCGKPFIDSARVECKSQDAEDYVSDQVSVKVDALTKQVSISATCKDMQTFSACTTATCQIVGKTHYKANPIVESVLYGLDPDNPKFGLVFERYTCECF